MVGGDLVQRQAAEVPEIIIHQSVGSDVLTVLGLSDGLVPLYTRTHVP